MFRMMVDGVAAVCFAAAAVLWALDAYYVAGGDVADSMFVLINVKTVSFYVRKAMLALTLAWFGCFIVMARFATGFPVLATLFLVAGCVITPLVFMGTFSVQLLDWETFFKKRGAPGSDFIGVIGGNDGPTTVWLSTKNEKLNERFQQTWRLHDQRLAPLRQRKKREMISEDVFTVAESGLVTVDFSSFTIDIAKQEIRFDFQVTNRGTDPIRFYAVFNHLEEDLSFFLDGTPEMHTLVEVPQQQSECWQTFERARFKHLLTPGETSEPLSVIHFLDSSCYRLSDAVMRAPEDSLTFNVRTTVMICAEDFTNFRKVPVEFTGRLHKDGTLLKHLE